MSALTPEQIREGITRFSHWGYRWDFGNGIVVAPPKWGEADLHELRMSLIFGAIARERGLGERPLTGARVLDVGCAEGRFSVEAKRLGADYVLGLEPRAEKVEQARFVATALGLDGIEFRRMSMEDLPGTVGQFDIVLFLGILYHLDRHYEAFVKLRKITGDLLVIDTQILPFSYPLIALAEESTAIPTYSYHSALVMVPTENAIRLMLAHAGFGHVQRLRIRDAGPWRKNQFSRRYLRNQQAAFLVRAGGGGESDTAMGMYPEGSIGMLQQRVARSVTELPALWVNMWNDADLAKRRFPGVLARGGGSRALRVLRVSRVGRAVADWLRR